MKIQHPNMIQFYSIPQGKNSTINIHDYDKSSIHETNGRWSTEEHRLFIQGSFLSKNRASEVW